MAISLRPTVIVFIFNSILINGMPGISRQFEGRKYIYVNQTKNFPDSQRECENMGGIIAPARTNRENIFLHRFRNNMGTGNTRMWLGGTDINRRGGGYIWLDGSPLIYTNWGGDEPINAGGDEHCMDMEADFVSNLGVWNDIDCTMFKLYFFCMINKDADTEIPM